MRVGKHLRTRWLKLILLAYLLLGVIYSVSLPILEAPDELWHYPYVRYLATERRLPPWDQTSPAKQESSQPPLYYATAALLTAWIETSSPETMLNRNPYWGYPAAGRVNDNKNVFLHTDDEAFPWQGTVLAVHVARLTNLLFGALTVIAAHLLAREILPESPILVAASTALVAFNPQFLFVSAAVSNDVAASAFSTLALWLLIRGLRRRYTPSRAVWLGVTIGLAALSKVSALALLPLALLATGFCTWRQSCQLSPTQRLSSFIVHSSLITLTASAAAWWYVRNAVLYGDPFGLQTHFETWWAHGEPLTPAQLWAQLPGVELSFWAAFGMGNVHLPRAFYLALRILVRLAFAGLLLWAVRAWRNGRRPGPRAWSLALLASWVVIVFVALVRWMQLVEAALGRLLFPAIGAIAILLTWGLARFTSCVSRLAFHASRFRSRISRLAPGALVVLLFCAAVASPFIAIQPAYASPPLLSDKAIADRARPAAIRFGDSIELVGYELDRCSVHPSEKIAVTLCWQAIAPMEGDYAYFVHFLGSGDRIVGARDTHPGLGRFPTSQWTPGDAFCDVVRVPVQEWVPTPGVYDVEIGWYEPGDGRRLRAADASGGQIELVLLDQIKVAPEEPVTVEVSHRVDAELGDGITLLGYDLSQSAASNSQLVVRPSQPLTITLYWTAEASVPHDYTVFVHLAAPEGAPYAQHDGQPRNGTYPTSFWAAGEVVTDPHTIIVPDDLPPGGYPLVTGMYVLETGERLPAFDAQGTRFPADAIPLTTLELRLDEQRSEPSAPPTEEQVADEGAGEGETQ